METPILKRHEQEPGNIWSVEDIFPSDQAWEQALDACKNFPEELASIASDVERETGVSLSRDTVLQALLAKFDRMEEALETGAFMETYRKKCFVLGKKVTVTRGNERFPAKALDVNARGELVVEANGQTMILPSGEVSVRM